MGKRQHYLSQFYLRGFSTDSISSNVKGKSKDKVWCYHKDSDEIIKIGINNIGFRNYYYSFKGDEGHNINVIDEAIQSLENQVAPTIKIIDDNIRLLQSTPLKSRKKISIKSLTPEQREFIIQYVIMYMNMNPKLRDDLTKKLDDFEYNILGEKSLGIKRSSTKKAIIETLINIGTDKKINFFNILMQKQIYIGYYPNNSTSFITTDNPIVRFRKNGKNGIKYYDTEIYLPLTQRCVLMLVDKDNGFENYFPIPDKKRISEFNKLIALNYYKLIVGRDKKLIEKMADTVKK